MKSNLRRLTVGRILIRQYDFHLYKSTAYITYFRPIGHQASIKLVFKSQQYYFANSASILELSVLSPWSSASFLALLRYSSALTALSFLLYNTPR